MRIIGGSIGGRRITGPGGHGKKRNHEIRPTSDRAREALFNIMGNLVENAFVLDLYAGTGAVGLESLSRGAACAFFVDHFQKPLQLIGQNISLCGFWDRSRIIQRDISKGLFFFNRSCREVDSHSYSWIHLMIAKCIHTF